MSEQANALSFGPQWIRDLSNGTNICVPPPSPGPKYKLAEYRYGKEEMLALFSEDFPSPDVGELAEFILKKTSSEPLACVPMTEEEQRTSFGSLNSAAVLKMMGRGGQRGGRGTSRGGRGSGRGGREGGGFYRGYSVDESSVKNDESWQRDTASRRLSWGENGRGGYERSTSREPAGANSGSDVTSPPFRQPSRALSCGNWRSSESGDQDDGGGWTVSGSQRSEKWRGSGRGGWHTQGSREEYQGGGGGGYGDSWKRAGRDRRNSDDLPEWSKSDNVFEPEAGTFDSSGAFCIAKEQRAVHDTGQNEKFREDEAKEDWDEELNNENHSSECDTEKQNQDKTAKEVTSDVTKDEKREESKENTKDIQQQANVRPTKMEAKPSTKNMTPAAEEKISETKSPTTDKQQDTNKTGSPSPSSATTTENHQDEIGAHLERVAESCIANLDVEGEDLNERQQAEMKDKLERSSPVEENTKWFYRDPQGQEQGPFRNEEMVEWFHHGYFTMQLQIRRQCDVMYLPLGEIMKRWQRVPFLPGPSPPPITHQQLVSEQTMLMQQQLLQQHYQQLQKQAILQQIQQQQQQEQQRRHADPSLHLPTTVDSSGRPLLTSHSAGGAAEAIWGAEPESPKGPWSPVSSNSPIWDKENVRQKSPSPEAVQKLVEEKAKKEEQLRIQQEKEDEEMRREKDRRRQEIQRQAEIEKRKQEEARQKKEPEQKQKKENVEQKQKQRQNEMREQQRQALMRLQKQQELQQQQREKVEQEKKVLQEQERQRQEQQRQEQQRQEQERHKMQEKQRQILQEQQRQEQDILRSQEQHIIQERQEQQRMQEQQRQEQQRREQERINERQRVQEQQNSIPRWGSQNSATLSLSEIQEQEEKNRRAHEGKMKELEARQRQLQSTTSHGWADKQPTIPSVKSLKSIQDEQARQQQQQQRNRQTKQVQQRTQAQTTSGAWSGSGWAAGNNNNIWPGAMHVEPEEEAGFWDEAARSVANTQPQKTNPTKISSPQPIANGKKASKKTTKEEESVRRIFQSTVSNDPFTEWCIISLSGLATSVDVPTFVTFLKEVDSPYEIHDYVKDFFGESNQAKAFAKEFIERKRTMQSKQTPAPAPKVFPAASDVVPRGCSDVSRVQSTNDASTSNGKNKKKKKQRMQKVDPRILGFSVNAAAERVNMGEIQSVEDAS